jgi:phosphate transport system protein
LNAFILVNVEQARRTIELDDLIDNYHQQIVRTLLTYMMEDRSVISQATYLMWVAHNLERIGDRCTNLGERTLSLVNGQVA